MDAPIRLILVEQDLTVQVLTSGHFVFSRRGGLRAFCTRRTHEVCRTTNSVRSQDEYGAGGSGLTNSYLETAGPHPRTLVRHANSLSCGKDEAGQLDIQA